MPPMTMPTILRSLRHLPRLPQARVARASHCSRGGGQPLCKDSPRGSQPVVGHRGGVPPADAVLGGRDAVDDARCQRLHAHLRGDTLGRVFVQRKRRWGVRG